MSDSRSARGPSNSASWTCGRDSGRRPSPNLTAGVAGAASGGPPRRHDRTPGDRRASSVGLVRETQQFAELGVVRGVLVADQLDGPWRAAGRGREGGGVSAWSRGAMAGEPRHDTWRPARSTFRTGSRASTRPGPDARPPSRVVEQPGQQHVAFPDPSARSDATTSRP
jgi:hypothetical protein